MVANALMLTGLYPLVPWAVRRVRGEEPGPLRGALGEWGMSVLVSAARPVGYLPLPGARARGPRPVIVLHGYAMNRANFVLLGSRLGKAGIGPILGFEYWTFGRVAAAAVALKLEFNRNCGSSVSRLPFNRTENDYADVHLTDHGDATG